ncbi:MAG: DNA replication/repair protein RecF [Candidatus Cloacimonetes bacterium]|nr:DNA replication/repair protein RecF [Candidatus Cloacimonadota bacterium]
MHIKSIKLVNFRNYSESKFDFDPKGCIIVGKNGIGKTNLLEAITYFAFGRSILNSRDSELIRFNEKFFKIISVFNNNQNDISFDISYQSYKNININDVWVKRISELYQYLQIIYFSPDDINLIIGTPKNRRSFLDLSIFKIYWGYIEVMKMYQNILTQRNALLKTDYHPAEKKAWDEQLATLGSDIIDYRLKFLKDFSPIFQTCYENISGYSERIDIDYVTQFSYKTNQIKKDFLSELKKIENQEKITQRTLIGPHLDDLLIKIDKQPVVKYASQGQKRSIVIALKIALAQMIQKISSTYPILIFDDTLAELDQHRSRNLIDLLSKSHQIFIATPNIDHYKHFELPVLNLENFLTEHGVQYESTSVLEDESSQSSECN